MASCPALAARNIANRAFFSGGSFIRRICMSTNRRGLEEFFPPGALESDNETKDLENVKTGRRWHASDLRQKSNSDLHKLWYVLLKERNMLQTVKAEAKRLQIPMPSPERIKKVQKSMAMIKVVIGERERAIRELENQGYTAALQEESLIREEEISKNKDFESSNANSPEQAKLTTT